MTPEERAYAEGTRKATDDAMRDLTTALQSLGTLRPRMKESTRLAVVHVYRQTMRSLEARREAARALLEAEDGARDVDEDSALAEMLKKRIDAAARGDVELVPMAEILKRAQEAVDDVARKRLVAMLKRWETEDVSGEPEWDIDDVKR